MRLTIFAAAALAAIAPLPAAAQSEWGQPSVEYSAVLSFTDGSGETLAHRFHYTAKRQRLDYKAGERDESVIVDQVAAAVFILYPAQKRYLKSPLVEPEFDLGIGRSDTKREKVGDETVAGHAATKYGVEARTRQGQEFKGLAWLTPERILVKLDGEVKQGRRTRQIKMTASEIKIGPVDPAVFQVPPGYSVVEDKRK